MPNEDRDENRNEDDDHDADCGSAAAVVTITVYYYWALCHASSCSFRVVVPSFTHYMQAVIQGRPKQALCGAA
jgi:hypothetical protein